MADDLREWKPRNRLANALAGGLKSVNAFASAPFGYSNPPGEMLVNALALPQIANTLERYSYGQPLTNAGKANVPYLPSDTADALMAVAPAVAKWPKQAAGAALGLMGAADTGVGKAMFIGAKAKAWDAAAAAKAAKMEQSGADARAIWQETGTFKGADGMWRQEISDHTMDFNDAISPVGDTSYVDGKWRGNLKTAVDHPELFYSYPELGKQKMQIGPEISKKTGAGFSNIQASFDPSSKTQYRLSTWPHGGVDKHVAAASHEIQHGVQDAESFARGGSPDEFSDADFSGQLLAAMQEAKAKYLADPTYQTEAAYKSSISRGRADAYLRMAGEAEARATQARVNLNPAERRAKFPYDSYDVPVNDLIVRR